MDDAMSAALTVHDETVTGQRTRSFTLSLPAARMTARELIRQRVEQEVAAYNATSSDVFQGLVQPTDTEWMLNGYRFKTRRPIDPAAQVALALEAFEASRIILMVDDRQVERLEDTIAFTPTTEVRFLRLMPLVGG
jgi:hypothetical protein